ncbi:MAG: hypothetical protein QM642_04320 [Edaphocola sp.]
MQAKTSLITTIAFIATAGLYGCSKNNDAPINTTTNDAALINALFDSLKSTPQSFQVTAGTYATITGEDGTIVTFNPSSFKTAAGTVITSGIIDIELTEMYTPGKMIANRVTTATQNNSLLSSGGAMYIKATLNGEEVAAGQYEIGFQQAAYSEDDMSLFYGEQNTDMSGANVIWGNDTSNTQTRTVKSSQNDIPNYYLFDSCTSFNWINCDHFYTAPDPKTDVQVTVNGSDVTAANTRIFVVFPAINSVANMYAFDSASATFSFGYPAYYLPVGTSIHAFLIAEKDSVYYMAEQKNITVSSGINITLTPVQTSISAIAAALSNL